ncbi:mannonate dehydratase [Bosea sp. OK403]|uniref:mannonate dehydratase n=1 Tax=Bosea sp. OK403 TaxID=1855286 RepID=UPI0008E032C1|nr:mannonate dehydratase [Bosea sp. OK403]SFJ56820.1 mannonate dehydratase [Bosea sp. OK403]
MEQTWRWWGPNDIIPLDHIRQTGATGLVTALHEVPAGEVWTREQIRARFDAIAANPALGLRWSVVESLWIHERIKLAEGDVEPLYENFRQSMVNLAEAGVHIICYNFMPVLDWARTVLRHRLPSGAMALRFNAHEFAAFDCFMLRREGAEADFSEEVLARAKAWFDASTQADRDRLLSTIMAGLPGAFDRYDIEGLRGMLKRYHGVDREQLRDNLIRFLKAIIPTAEKVGIRMAIHPDDPPRSLLGLPRIAGSMEDFEAILTAVDSPSNGLTFCTGSLGANPKNDPTAIAERFADRIHFAHLRNVANDPDGSFMEADHLGGDTNMVAVVRVLLREQARRKAAGRADWRIPFRSDHGHELLDDIGKPTFPGYPAIGRLRGLAELRGVMTALADEHGWPL